MANESQELLQALQQIVGELKRGITSYAAFLEKPLQPEVRHQIEQLIKQMHQTAVKINVGIEGIQEVEQIKQQLNAFAAHYHQQSQGQSSQQRYGNHWE